jgi:hypothetical protein
MKQDVPFSFDVMGFSEMLEDMAEALADDRPTALIITDSDESGRLEALITGAGARILGAVPIAEATVRLDRTARVDLVVIHCRDPQEDISPTLFRLDAMARLGDIALVAIADLAALGFFHAHLGEGPTHLLSEPTATDLAATIGSVLHARSADMALHDIGREEEAHRLERLSAEVSRLARTLDALTETAWPIERQQAFVPDLSSDGEEGTESELKASHVRELLRTRRLRDQFLPGDLFADPAWDMVLDLMAARLSGERVSVSSLCIAASVPPTTALRWIRQLTERGIFQREADPADGRRVFVVLSDEAADAIAGWFSARRRILGSAAG